MKQFKPIFLVPTLEGRALVGIASLTAIIIIMGWVAIKESARMQAFTDRAEARSIEAGAKIYENNCVACHGEFGLGKDGVAPALNTPHLFGYDFFAQVDTQIQLTQALLNESSDPEAITLLQTRLVELQAERVVLADQILYDWTLEAEQLNAAISAIDGRIVAELDGVDNAARLPVYISQVEASEIAPLLQELDTLLALGDDAVSAEPEATEPEAAAEPEAEAVEPETVEAEPEVTEPEAAEPEAAESEAEAVEPETVEAEAVPLIPGLSAEQSIRVAELEAEIATIEEGLAPYRALAEERNALMTERNAYQALNDAQAEVERLRLELAAVEGQISALGEVEEGLVDPNAAERESLTAQAREARSALEDAELARSDAYAVLIENGYIADWGQYNPTAVNADTGLTQQNRINRLAQVGWSGALNDFVRGTLVGGRPTSSSYWPQPMAAWAQSSGGPLRSDQIKNLVDYILNWDREFTVQDLRAVNQFAKVPADPALAGLGGGDDAIGTTNVTAIEQGIAAGLEDESLIAGDPSAGQGHFQAYGCAGCHGAQPGTGPALAGMWNRAVNNEEGRLSQTGYEDDPQGYMIQSIVQPNAYIVPGYISNIMPATFADQLSYQQLIDILAYIQSQ